MSKPFSRCIFCGRLGESEIFRPYGPGGSDVCVLCAVSPEHEPEIAANFRAIFDAAKAVNGYVMITDHGPEPL